MGTIRIGGTSTFWGAKRLFDLGLSLALLPVLVVVCAVVLMLNPIFNPGPFLYLQCRVGREGRHFTMIKLRTMHPAIAPARFANQEAHRITRFGRLLRRYRLDELPQLINVICGDMSLIGPRPEQPVFADDYARTLPGYTTRHLVRPGISGLAQVVQGYTNDTQGTARKLSHDLRYIRRAGFRLEGYVIWRTFVTLATGYGAV